MGKVIVGLSMSLDGFIAGPKDSVEHIFDWYSSGDVAVTFPDGRMTVNVSHASARLLREIQETAGALVQGRRTFDITHGWGGKHPLDVPVFVVTHTPPAEWAGKESPFTFVTDGIESAVAQAKEAAGEKNVAVGAASIAQQCLNTGLLDEIHIDLAPVLLGEGIRLFEHLGVAPLPLERIRVIEAPDVTHLAFRVLK